MKKLNPLRESLGITQAKMASLIGVSRSQLSMYELGQRELPTKAMITLSELSRYLLENPKESAKGANGETQTADIRKFLERQIAEATLLRLKLERKMTNAAKKLEDAAAQLQLVGFSEVIEKKGKALPAPPLNLITHEAARTLKSKLSLELYEDGIKLRRLESDLLIFEDELKKLKA